MIVSFDDFEDLSENYRTVDLSLTISTSYSSAKSFQGASDLLPSKKETNFCTLAEPQEQRRM